MLNIYCILSSHPFSSDYRCLEWKIWPDRKLFRGDRWTRSGYHHWCRRSVIIPKLCFRKYFQFLLIYVNNLWFYCKTISSCIGWIQFFPSCCFAQCLFMDTLFENDIKLQLIQNMSTKFQFRKCQWPPKHPVRPKYLEKWILSNFKYPGFKYNSWRFFECLCQIKMVSH